MKTYKSTKKINFEKNKQIDEPKWEVDSPEFGVSGFHVDLEAGETKVVVEFKGITEDKRTFTYKSILTKEEAEASILNEEELKGSKEI